MSKQKLLEDLNGLASDLLKLSTICEGTDPRSGAYRQCSKMVRDVYHKWNSMEDQRAKDNGVLPRDDAIDQAVSILEYHCKGEDLIETAVELLLQAKEEEDE